LAWALGRVPILLIALYLGRNAILDLIEHRFDLGGITELATNDFGTPATRILLALGLFVLLLGIAAAARRMPALWGYVCAMCSGGALLAVTIIATDTPKLWFIVLVILLGLNWLTNRVLATVKAPTKPLDLIVRIAPAVGETLFANRYIDWLGDLVGWSKAKRDGSLLTWAPGALIVAIAAAVVVHGYNLAGFERAMRGSKDVKVIATGDFNGVVLTSDRRELLVNGHGQDRLLKYDVKTWKPTVSRVDINGAQSLTLDRIRNQALLYDTERKKILIFGVENLDLVQEIPVENMSPGDPWIAVDPISDAIVLASEADQLIGRPLIVFNRADGSVRFTGGQDAGNILIDPTRPVVFLSYFRRRSGVEAVDLRNGSVIARAPADEHIDRMEIDPKRSELLVASTVAGRIQRFDQITLKPKGAYKGAMGVRTIALDAEHDTALVASLVTGKITAIKLSTGKVIKSWYLGPWLRTIELDREQSVAYVTSVFWLYRLDYASALK
jgi:hypothetical protein